MGGRDTGAQLLRAATGAAPSAPTNLRVIR